MAIVTIVGRPNVGKSSIFNRILGRRAAIVDDVPGVTRDRLYGEARWEGKRFYLVDTGGIVTRSDEPLMDGIIRQVQVALDESDAVLFVIDGREGPTPLDEEISLVLRKHSKAPLFLLANKIDDPVHESAVANAYKLGFERVFGVSAVHYRNFDDVLDALVALLPVEEEEPEEESEEISVALVGRPNVGKSSILNALAGEERALVSPIPGTTRDAIDSVVELDGRMFRFIDTAGLRRKSRVDTQVEYYSTLRSYEAIDRSSVAVLVMDGQEPATDQEKRLAGHVLERGKGLVLAVNKWDLAPSREDVGDRMVHFLRKEFVFASHAPHVFISAKSGRGLGKLPQHIVKVHENRHRRVSTSALNRVMRDLMAFERLPSDSNGKFLRLYFCSQVRTAPPSFAFFVNDPAIVTQSFARHVEKLLRGVADFEGVPLRIYWRRSESEGRKA